MRSKIKGKNEYVGTNLSVLSVRIKHQICIICASWNNNGARLQVTLTSFWETKKFVLKFAIGSVLVI